MFPEADASTFYFDLYDKRTVVIDEEWYQKHIYIIGDKDKEWKYIPPDDIKRVRKN